MANYFYLTLDTTAPSSASIILSAGATYATSQILNATISTTDSDTTSYQMKLWGDVDATNNSNIQLTEGTSTWITFNATQQIKLSDVDGSKTIYLKIRDDVQNESGVTSDSIILDMALPIVTISSQDVVKISKISGKDACSFAFQCNVPFTDYIVKVVSAVGSDHTTGNEILMTNGSTNMSGTGTFASASPITCSIKGLDLEACSAGDSIKTVKVFVLSDSGIWSV